MEKELKFPPIPEERKKELVMSVAYAYSRHHAELCSDLTEMVRNEAINTYRQECERRLEYALRYLIPHPIKGEITRGKFRYRGLYIKEHAQHLKSSEIVEHDGKYTLYCYFMYPTICGRPSRSGKRKAFELCLAFDKKTMPVYKAWCQMRSTIIYATSGRNCGKTAARYKCSGLVEQIKRAK